MRKPRREVGRARVALLIHGRASRNRDKERCDVAVRIIGIDSTILTSARSSQRAVIRIIERKPGGLFAQLSGGHEISEACRRITVPVPRADRTGSSEFLDRRGRTMIRGVHTMFYSSEPEELRASSGTSSVSLTRTWARDG